MEKRWFVKYSRYIKSPKGPFKWKTTRKKCEFSITEEPNVAIVVASLDVDQMIPDFELVCILAPIINKMAKVICYRKRLTYIKMEVVLIRVLSLLSAYPAPLFSSIIVKQG